MAQLNFHQVYSYQSQMEGLYFIVASFNSDTLIRSETGNSTVYLTVSFPYNQSIPYNFPPTAVFVPNTMVNFYAFGDSFQDTSASETNGTPKSHDTSSDI